MPSVHHPDLALLARSGDRELRPVLLTHHTREFVAAHSRDRRAIVMYEALALGLIPLVPDDVVADVSAMLRQVADAPPRVLALLVERRALRSDLSPEALAPSEGLTRHAVAELAGLARPAVDRALAGNAAAPLDAHVRRELVGRAVRDEALARALLARADLSAAERGALFVHADAAERDRIRAGLETAVAAASPTLPPLSDRRRARLLKAAAAADLPALLAELGRALGLAPAPAWQLDEPVGAELFALALAAAGLSVEDSVRVLLTADRRIAASVPAVFRLRQVCRTTPRAVAWHLLGAAKPVRKARPPSAGQPAERVRRAESARAAASEAARPAPARRTSAPAGRRSRSTTGPDRS